MGEGKYMPQMNMRRLLTIGTTGDRERKGDHNACNSHGRQQGQPYQMLLGGLQ